METSPNLFDFLPPDPGILDPFVPGFHVQELIAKGGMGAIYRGFQASLQRDVAIKIFPMAHYDHVSAGERFQLEGLAMARLSHQHVVQAIECGQTSDYQFLYLVMEYVVGSDLATAIDEQSLTHEAKLKVLIHLCEALQHTHEEGVIHRDIKPSNVLLDRRNDVKLTDFGLATFVNQPVGNTNGSDMELGTPGYTAPEVFGNDPIDHRADIYSLGALIYETLTGLTPGDRLNRPSRINQQLDARFDDLILKARHPDRDQRHSSVREICDELKAIRKTFWLLGRTGTTAPAGKRPALATLPPAPRVAVPKVTPLAQPAPALRVKPYPGNADGLNG